MSAISRRKKRRLLKRLAKRPCPACPVSLICFTEAPPVKTCKICKRRFIPNPNPEMYAPSWVPLPRPFDTVCSRSKDEDFMCKDPRCHEVWELQEKERKDREHKYWEERVQREKEQRKAAGKKGPWKGLHQKGRAPKKKWGAK